jgi:PAS domain S-box-containing protein
LEMSKAIREMDEKVPIIVTSAYSDTDYFLKSIELGVTQYVLKPIDREQFWAAIERCTYQIELEKRVKVQNATIRKLSQAVEQSPEMIIIADFEGKAEYINPKFTEFTGFSLEEIQEGRFGFYGDEMLTDAIQSVLEAIKNKGEWKGERLAKSKNGVEYWEMRTISPLKDEEGILTHFLIVIQDITDRKKLEADLYKAKNELELRVAERTAELLKINEQLKLEIAERKMAEETASEMYEQNLQLLSSITSIVIGVSKDGMVFQWNQVAEKTFGIPTADVIGRPFSECSINWNWKEVLDKIQLCREKKESVYLEEIRYQRADGSQALLGLAVNPIGKQKDHNTSFFLFGIDITDRKKREAKKALSQKLESIGQLAAGIAHEINTPIQYVGDNLYFIKESFGKLEKLLDANEQLVKANQSGNCNPDLAAEIDNLAQTVDWPYLKTEIPKAIEQSLEGAARVTKIVQAMKDFSHPSQGVKVSADINQALESTITISKNEWKYIADLITDFDPELPAVECIIEEINQVVLNMIINAVDAIKETNPGPQKREIMVKTRNKKDFVEITISDTGIGMPPGILAKIFDPFFTTKEVGKGTGQGLTLAHDIVVNKHNGSIEAESKPGKGTTFRIMLPVKGAPVKNP